MNEQTKLLTVQQVAEILSVQTSWVYEQARKNKIPHVRLGKYLRFKMDEIHQYVEAKKTESSS